MVLAAAILGAGYDTAEAAVITPMHLHLQYLLGSA